MTAEEELKVLKEMVREIMPKAHPVSVNHTGCAACELYRSCAPPAPGDPYKVLEEVDEALRLKFEEDHQIMTLRGRDIHKTVRDALAARGEGG